MAMQHIDADEAELMVKILHQQLDLGLDADTINRVWPGLIMVYPLSTPSTTDYKTFNTYPAAVQPISRGLRVNVIIHKDKVLYKNKLGEDILGWEMYDEQFMNLAQGQSTVFDGHAIVVDGTTIVETDNKKYNTQTQKTLDLCFGMLYGMMGLLMAKILALDTTGVTTELNTWYCLQWIRIKLRAMTQ